MKLRTGDHICVPGRLGIEHHGIVDCRGKGGAKVIHASKSLGRVVVSSLREFTDGSRPTLVARAQQGERLAIADRAREKLDDDYDVIGANCEHLAYGASHDDESSPQLRRAVGGAVLLCLGLMFLEARS